MSLDDTNFSLFCSSDWKNMKNLCAVLKPIFEATIFAQNRSSSAAHIIPLIKLIEHKLIKAPATEEYTRVRTAIVDGINNRMPGFLYMLICKNM